MKKAQIGGAITAPKRTASRRKAPKRTAPRRSAPKTVPKRRADMQTAPGSAPTREKLYPIRAPKKRPSKKRPYSPKPSSGGDTAEGNTTQGQAATPKKSDYSKKAIRLNQKSQNKFDRDKVLKKKATKAYAKGKDNKAERIQARRMGVQEKDQEFMKKAYQAGYRKKGGRVIKGNSLRFTRKK